MRRCATSSAKGGCAAPWKWLTGRRSAVRSKKRPKGKSTGYGAVSWPRMSTRATTKGLTHAVKRSEPTRQSSGGRLAHGAPTDRAYDRLLFRRAPLGKTPAGEASSGQPSCGGQLRVHISDALRASGGVGTATGGERRSRGRRRASSSSVSPLSNLTLMASGRPSPGYGTTP